MAQRRCSPRAPSPRRDGLPCASRHLDRLRRARGGRSSAASTDVSMPASACVPKNGCCRPRASTPRPTPCRSHQACRADAALACRGVAGTRDRARLRVAQRRPQRSAATGRPPRSSPTATCYSCSVRSGSPARRCRWPAPDASASTAPCDVARCGSRRLGLVDADRLALCIDPATRLVRRVRFTLEGSRDARRRRRGRTFEHARRFGVVWPMRSYGGCVHPSPCPPTTGTSPHRGRPRLRRRRSGRPRCAAPPAAPARP